VTQVDQADVERGAAELLANEEPEVLERFGVEPAAELFASSH
jgi:hypothetical protein